MADSDGPLKLAVFLIAGGGASLFGGLRRLRKLRQIQDTPCSEIRSAPQGLVEVEGHALFYREQLTNSEGKSAAYHAIKFEKLVSRGKNSNWVTLYNECLGDSFIFSDGTGIALVEVAKADLLLQEKTHEWRKISNDEKAALILRYGAKVRGLPSGEEGVFSIQSRFRVVESFILDGAPVYVRGSFQTSVSNASYTIPTLHLRFLEKLIRLKKEPTGRAKAFDLNRDGKIDEAELSKGSEKLLYQSRHAILPEDRPEPVSIQGTFRHDQTHGLTIGDSHQTHLTRKLSSWNLLRIIGGALLIASGVGVLVQQLSFLTN